MEGTCKNSICSGMLLQDNYWPVQRSSFAPILCTLHSLGSNFDFCSSGSYVYTRLRCWWWPRQRQDSWKLFIDFNFSSSVGNTHGRNCKKWAKKVGAKLVLHAFANLNLGRIGQPVQNNTQLAKFTTYGGWVGESTYIDGEKNYMYWLDTEQIIFY